MKNLCLPILILLHANAIACSCMQPKFTEKYMQSDFVAHVKITKVYENEGDEQFYKSDILIYELYKGENISSIYTEGSSIPDQRRGSCGIYFPEHTELIIYASKKADRWYIYDSCSGTVQIKGKNPSEKRELQMLNDLKKHQVNFTSKIQFYKKNGFTDDLKKFEGIQLSKTFCLLEITFYTDLKIKSIKQVTGFGTEIDHTLMDLLQNSEWASEFYEHSSKTLFRNKVPDDSKLLIGFYFYPPEKGYQSFVSDRDH